ncbi:MAG: penicillin-binding transpeptidase domain-containing protein [Candidatus Shapirobacteria bacterium]|nr:penicillin-binding transpeptidase domain-containing protein [Candidatus Shapirobacteria bacterium]
MNEVGEDLGKYWLLRWSLVVSFGLLFSGAFKLTIIKQKYYQAMARDNRIMESMIPAGRGVIYDRKGRIIDKSVYQYFKMDNGNKLYQDAGDFDGYKFEGKDLAYELKRHYPYGEALAFVSGYVGKVADSDIKDNNCQNKLQKDEVVGRGGIEEFFDCDLRGVDGKRLIEVDAKGKYLRELGRQEPEQGKSINLSIDAYWQDKIYKLLGGRKAVVIMSEPKTGKIISLVSSPAFDPNVFSFSQDNNAINSYLGDSIGLPLLNRAVAGKYHPGSVFKIVMATAGLESGVIDKNSTYEDTGIIKVGEYSYSNWQWTKNGGTDGMVDITKAIKRSNDIYFYKLGEALGVDRIKTWADKYGYGVKTGIELSNEVTGLVPDEKWKLENKGEKWFLGNTYHMSIGQGDLDVTPLQVNQMTNIIANKGVKCNLTLLKDKQPQCQSLNIKRETWETIREGMKEACKPGGTAWPLFNFKTSIACKTGTAEVGDGSNDTHAWLTAFAPADSPEIVITVMVERGGEGSDEAAPIVGDILKDWFNEPNTLVPRYKKVMEE